MDLHDHVVLVASAPCALRSAIAAELERAGATVLVADSRSGAQRLLGVFRCAAVVAIIGSPLEGLRSLPASCPAPRYVAIDAAGGASALEGFDAVLPIGVASSPSAVRLRLAELLAPARTARRAPRG